MHNAQTCSRSRINRTRVPRGYTCTMTCTMPSYMSGVSQGLHETHAIVRNYVIVIICDNL